MGDFEKEGFLGKEIEEYKNNRNLSDTEERAKTIAREVNRVLLKFKNEIEVDENKIEDQLLCALFARMIHSFSAVIILCDYGLSSDAHSVARNLIVEIFIIESIIKDKNNYNLYIANYYWERKRRLKRFREKIVSQNYARKDSEIDPKIKEINQEIKECEKKLSLLDIKKKVTEKQFAEKAGMEEDYRTFYTYMCDFVHANIRTLDRFLRTNEEGVIKEFDAGPKFEDVPILLFSCSDYVLRAIQSLSSYFGIGNGVSKDISTLVKDIENYIKSINSLI